MKTRIPQAALCVFSIAVIVAGAVVSGQADDHSTKEVSVSVSELLGRADSLFKGGQYDDARAVFLAAVADAEKAGDNSSLTEAYAMIARCFLITEKKEEGRPWIEKAAAIARNDEPPGWSRYLGVKGRFEWKDDLLEKASSTFKEMYQYCSGHKLYERAIDAAHMVAITAGPEEQVEWGLKGIREAEAGNVTGWLGPLWNNLGWTYEHDGKFAEAIDAYQRAREYHFKYGDQKNKLCADWALGHAYRLNGDTLNAAVWITPGLLVAFESLGDTEFEGWTLKELAEIALLQSRPDSALELLIRAEEKLRAAEMPSWDSEGYKKLQDEIEALKRK